LGASHAGLPPAFTDYVGIVMNPALVEVRACAGEAL
jgi:hypothetical protein